MPKYTDAEIARADGPFEAPAEISFAYLQEKIAVIAQFPADLERVMQGLEEAILSQPYRAGGWQLKQVIHHIADSHMQAFSRFKLSLTETNPTIKPYIQNAWAETTDSLLADAHLSLAILKPLHQRWVILMRSMQEADFHKTYVHPEYNKTFTLAHVTGLYAWHGHHHLKQIEMYLENRVGSTS